MTCPNCRATAPAGARFCAECGQDLRLRGDERRVVTVVFADLVGYTSLSETLDPESVKRLVDGCFEHLVADIEAFGGRVDKIVGDAIVALFGAPVAHEDDAERAVRAALRMQATLERVAAERDVPVQMRVGVNTGEVLVGALRSGGDYTAMGDVVNTADRLQKAAAPGTVLVGPATYAATRRVLDYEELEPIAAKGREALVPAWRAEGAAAPPGYRPDRERAPLVGREAELGLLRHSVATAFRHRRASLLLVLGEAGVGKSRLAGELAAAAAVDHDAIVLEGRCVPYGEANVWWPVADALRHGCGIHWDDPPAEARATAAAAVRAALGPDAPAGEVDDVLEGLLFLMGYESELRGIDPARARESATAAVVTFAERSSLQRPVVVVLSDLHWADDPVLELVDTLLDRLAARRFVVLASARRSLEERWRPPPGRHNLVVLTLDPLRSEATAELLAALAGPDLDPDLAAALLDRSGGNPFFLEELVALLEDGRGVEGLGGTAVLPDTLRGLVAARLDGLSPDERRVLDDCAVLGRRGSVGAIEVMARKHLGIGDVHPLLARLEAKELLVLDGEGPSARWTFRSDVVREVAYSTLTKADRARSHAGIAAWMEEREDVRNDAVLDRLTHHYLRAADLVAELGGLDELGVDLTGKALHWIAEAAGRAEQGELHVVAAGLYGEGLRLLEHEHGGPHRPHAHGEEHRAFLTGRGRALAQQRHLAEARVDVEAAVAEARAGDDGGPGLARSLLVLADVEQKDLDFAASRAALDEAGARFEALGDASGCAEVLRVRGFDALLRHDYAEADALLEDARRRFVELGDRRGVAWALQNLAWSAFYSGRPDEAEVRLREAAATFEELGDTGGRGWAVGLLAWTRFQQGHSLEAEAVAESILEDIRRRNDRWALGMMLVLLGSVRLWTGRAAAALPCLTEARELFEAIGDPQGRRQAAISLGRALVVLGRVEEGLAHLPRPDGVVTDVERRLLFIGAAAALVQVGDVAATAEVLDRLGPLPGLDGGLFAADDEHAVVEGLHRLQRGEAADAVALLAARAERTRPAVDTNLESALALARAVAGETDEALVGADLVRHHERASYLDRLLAGLAGGLARVRSGDVATVEAAFAELRAEVAATDDVVTAALVDLADATAAAALGADRAAERRQAADVRLAELGLVATGWRSVFERAVGVSPVA